MSRGRPIKHAWPAHLDGELIARVRSRQGVKRIAWLLKVHPQAVTRRIKELRTEGRIGFIYQWTVEDDRRLIALRHRKATFAAIGAELGRGAESCRHRHRLLMLRGRDFIERDQLKLELEAA